MNYHDPKTEEEFNEAMAAASGPVLLFFTATFCGPSRIMAELFDDLFEVEDFDFDLVEIDVEALPAITRKYQVKGTPEIIMLKGEATSSRLGTMSYGQLVEYLESEGV